MKFCVVFLFIMLSGYVMSLEEEDDRCERIQNCVACTRALCTWYSTTNNQFCGGRSVDSRLYLYKSRRVGGCFKDTPDARIDTTAYQKMIPAGEQTTQIPMRNEGGKQESSAMQAEAGKSEMPRAAGEEKTQTLPRVDARGEKEEKNQFLQASPLTTVIKDSMKKGYRQKLKEINCKLYVVMNKQINRRERDEQRIYNKCMLRT